MITLAEYSVPPISDDAATYSKKQVSDLTEKLGSLEQRLGKMTWISGFSFKYTESLPVGLKGQVATDFQCDGDSVPIGGGAWNVHDAAVYQNENKDGEDGNVWRVGAANLSGVGRAGAVKLFVTCAKISRFPK